MTVRTPACAASSPLLLLQPIERWPWINEHLRLDPTLAGQFDVALHVQLAYRPLGKHHRPVLPAGGLRVLKPDRACPLFVLLGQRPIQTIVGEPGDGTVPLHGQRSRRHPCPKRLAEAVLVHLVVDEALLGVAPNAHLFAFEHHFTDRGFYFGNSLHRATDRTPKRHLEGFETFLV